MTRKGRGEVCSCCNKERLIEIRGAIVCPSCDAVASWPGVKKL